MNSIFKNFCICNFEDFFEISKILEVCENLEIFLIREKLRCFGDLRYLGYTGEFGGFGGVGDLKNLGNLVNLGYLDIWILCVSVCPTVTAILS